MSTKHIATYQGVTFKRTSANRVYSHAVIVESNGAAQQEIELARIAVNYPKERRLNESYAAKGWDPPAWMIADGIGDKFREQGRESSRKWLDQNPNVEVVGQRAIAARKAAGQDGVYFTLAGWTSRLDLATKLAASRTSPACRAIIVEASHS